jgi:hypothetical protein
MEAKSTELEKLEAFAKEQKLEQEFQKLKDRGFRKFKSFETLETKFVLKKFEFKIQEI